MNKFSKAISAALLVLQVFAAVPTTSFAETRHVTDNTEQVSGNTKSSDRSETDSSSEEPTASSSSSEDSESFTKPSSDLNEVTDETSTTSSNSASSSCTTPSETQPNEGKKEESEQVEKTVPDKTEEQSTVTSEQQIQKSPVYETTDDQYTIKEANTGVFSDTEKENSHIHFEKNETVENFIQEIGEAARKIGKEKDLYASVMISQAILESASGQSKLAQAPNYNLFGIKGSHHGKYILMTTQEDSGNGNLYTTQDTFKVYEQYEESFNDYATLLREGISGNSYYYEGAWKSNAPTYQSATKYLMGRYATDTQYDQKLNDLIETYDLTQYDKEVQNDKEAREESVSAQGYQVPLETYVISSTFGNRGEEFHRGIDLAANQGEPIYAAKAGIVIKAEYHSSWGNYVVIQHDDGLFTLYAHQQEYVVKAGEQVQQGQTIGYVGTTGNSTGPHLHLEINRESSLEQQKLLDPQSIIFGE
ncbi:TPA: peptidoglycan DD-metalloendopeptidase family protein [Enterococcus faecium]|nr:peptidoglycan DD-metalloendopeptidase family protein [Enterococcus faecium]HEL7538186.1 peptidoglycan DD-metalloendopeptidase family protein [Enterococcus faecium]